MSRALDVLQTEGDVLKPFAARTHIRGTNHDLHGTGQLHKEKRWHQHHKFEESLKKASAGSSHHCHPPNHSWCHCRDLQQHWPESCALGWGWRWSHAHWGATRLRASSGNRSQDPARSADLCWLLIPRGTTSFPQWQLMLACFPSLCGTQPLLCTVWTLPLHATTRQYIEWACCGGSWPGAFCSLWHRLPRTPGQVMPGLHFYGDPEGVEKEERAAAERRWLSRSFSSRTAPAPKLTAMWPQVIVWSEGTCALPRSPTVEWTTGPASQATEVWQRPLRGLKWLSQKNGNKVERKYTVSKIYVQKIKNIIKKFLTQMSSDLDCSWTSKYRLLSSSGSPLLGKRDSPVYVLFKLHSALKTCVLSLTSLFDF